EGAGAAADLVHQHQALAGGVVEDVGGLGHFHHEGGPAAGQIVGGTDAGEDAVHRADLGMLGGDEAANVGEDGDQRRLAHEGGFTAHVGAGDDQHAAVAVEHQVVGDEGFVEHLLHDRVAAGNDVQAGFVGQFRARQG